MSKTILVTGAAGFIGSHVSEMLTKRGDKVVGLDNLNDYYDPARKLANLEEIAHENFEFVKGDIRDRELLAELFPKHNFDAVVHLAAMAGVRASVSDPHLYYDVNLTGTLNLLEEARKHSVHFVFAGTSSAYGRTETVPFVEEDSADLPLAPYPASKRGAELLGHSYHHLHGVSFTALRFFTVYGPRGRPDMMAYKVLDNIHFGREVPIYNDGKMHRDWTYVTDIASGVVGAVDHPNGYQVVNLGRGEPVLLADFVKMIEKLSGKASNLTPKPMMAADVSYTYARIDRAKERLGYEPKVSVTEGVKRFFDWYTETVLNKG